MKKQQVYLAGAGLIILISLLAWGKTESPKEKTAAPAVQQSAVPSFDIEHFLADAKKDLSISQSDYVAKLESSVSRGDVNSQLSEQYSRLASFWKDSVHNHDLYVFYIYKAAMLVNSEKSLTFAARQIFKEFRNEPDLAKRGWKAERAIELFEKAAVINPGNDSIKVDLGSCYVFGKGMAGDAQETMKGIQQLLQVVHKDSANMHAQLVLGIGGVISRQYDKAVDRLLKVVEKQPGNLEAISWLADAYAGSGDKQNAIKWYETGKRIVNDPAFSKEVDERIKMLK